MSEIEPKIGAVVGQGALAGKDFAARVEALRGERQLSRWSRSLGVHPNVLTRMRQGHLPGAAILRRFVVLENVSLNWLLLGWGPAFQVEPWLQPEVFLSRLQQLMAQAAFECHLLDSIEGPVGLLRWPLDEAGLEPAESWRSQVLCCPWQPGLGEALSTVLEHEACHYHFLPEADTRRIRQGEVGNYRIYGWEGGRGLLDHPLPANFSPFRHDGAEFASSLAEPAATYLPLDGRLMQACISRVETLSQRLGIGLSAQRKARIITTLLRHAQRSGLSPSQLDDNLVLALLETD